ncbi:uncharacterized protein LOC110675940 [Aedes aegypti]|uniref:MD-2-related lipid-recognition domain-containing protein n=1 Tax=Aedes aegypti TaxID=7159 RepID=A0A6I8U122_AEDAE|nr:uncharacterized protein LOC110675940 [Aedes aegypti]
MFYFALICDVKMYRTVRELLLSVLIILAIHEGICARVKEFVCEKAATCSSPNAHQFVIQFPGPLNCTMGSNIVQFHGNFTVTETIQEPLELLIIPNRCTMDMKSCELFNKLTLTNICRYINDESGILAPFFRSIEPNIQCPIKPGFYQFKKSIIDLTFFLKFPLEGYRWQSSMKLYSRSKPKKELYCLSEQVSMRWVKKL